MPTINVTKLNGSTEPLAIDKLTKSVEWATAGIPNVSASDILMNMNVHFYDGIPTSTILDLSIKTADEMSSVRNPNYDKVAVNLYMQKLYHQVFGSTEPVQLTRMLQSNVATGNYSKLLITGLSGSEYVELCNYIDYSRNFNFTYAGLQYLYDKYAIHHDGKPIEDPQTMFMAIAIDIFRDYHINRLDYIKLAYDALSLFKVSLPTPEMKALRTSSTMYASCCDFQIGDSIESWDAGLSALMNHTVHGAGVGVDISALPSIGDKVKQGTISHGGKLPMIHSIDKTIQLCQQNGRRGSATPFVNCFDPEIQSVLSLKSPRTDVNKRINDLKYCIKFSNYFYELTKSNGTMYFYSTRAVPGLNELFNSSNQAEFIELYESSTHLASSSMPAQEFFELFVQERFENGIYYVMNIDHANSNTPYLEPISHSNICLEHIVPTKPLAATPNSAIGICILTNLNQANVTIEELPIYTDLVVRMQNNIMHRQVHPTEDANQFVANYRSIGIGFSNHAYWLAKHNWKYGDTAALAAFDEWCEHFQFGLMRSSCNLARELEPAPYFDRTSYSTGVMPYERTGSPNSFIRAEWYQLQHEILQWGMYNTSLSMLPPSATSSVIAGQTAGMNPIRNLLTIKDSKTGNVKQFAPECNSIGHQYDFAFESTDMTARFFTHVAVAQQWLDMGISTDTYYNPELYSDGKVPMRTIMNDIFLANDLGLKTIYYSNVFVADGSEEPTTCQGGGCEV